MHDGVSFELANSTKMGVPFFKQQFMSAPFSINNNDILNWSDISFFRFRLPSTSIAIDRGVEPSCSLLILSIFSTFNNSSKITLYLGSSRYFVKAWNKVATVGLLRAKKTGINWHLSSMLKSELTIRHDNAKYPCSSTKSSLTSGLARRVRTIDK